VRCCDTSFYEFGHFLHLVKILRALNIPLRTASSATPDSSVHGPDVGLLYQSGRLYMHGSLRAALDTLAIPVGKARLVARHGGWQAGIEAGNDPADMVELGQKGLFSSSGPCAGTTPLSGLCCNARLAYSDTWRNTLTMQPESVEMALTLHNNGSALTLSLFRHMATRVNAAPFCYWKNTAGGLLFEGFTQGTG
jgi:hypothetical protein